NSATQPGVAPGPLLYKIRDLIYEAAGIFQPDHKLRLLEGACAKRMSDKRVTNIRSYYEMLTMNKESASEMCLLLNEITIGETCFFRNQPQLDALRHLVLPAILERRARQSLRHLRLWSAGCSTGEEPYTLAILLLEESEGLLKNCTFEICATDLNDRSLEHARQAVYGDYATRNLTPRLRDKYFIATGDKLKVKDAVKDKIKLSRLNLLDDSKMVFMKGMDVIFCCNVLIYFDTRSKKRVYMHFYNNLQADGYLFLGHSESMFGVSDDFRLVHMPSTTGYVKAERKKA